MKKTIVIHVTLTCLLLVSSVKGQATELAGEAYRSGKGILEIIRERQILSEQQIKELLDPVKLSGMDKSKYVRK